MNYKHLILIALALCLCFAVAPVTAIWNGENWVAADHNAGCDKVAFDSQTGNTNCYRDVNPAIALQNSIDTHQGTVKFIVRAGYSTLSPSVSISNDLSTDPNETVSVDILPDGEVEYQLAAGNYTAVLDNFNLPDETAHFVIVPGKESFVPFIGQATSGIPKVETPVITRPVDRICFILADYFGAWSSYTKKFGNGGHNDVSGAIENYINTHPNVKTFTISAQVGDIIINGDHVYVQDKSVGWVKTLTTAYTYKDTHGHIHVGGFVIVENDSNSYPGSNPLHLSQTATITLP